MIARHAGGAPAARRLAGAVLAGGLAVMLAGCPPLPPVPGPGPGAPISWSRLPGWSGAHPSRAWRALLEQCQVMPARDPRWTGLCTDASLLPDPDDDTARAFFETRFAPHAMRDARGGTEGLITGYYEPLLQGRRHRTARFRFPVYGRPDDLLTVDLGALYPALKGQPVRGRLQGRRVVPYYSRAEITRTRHLPAPVLAWVDDPVALFFLQIQGSGRIRLPSGKVLDVGYADQNGYPYQAIGRQLVALRALDPPNLNLENIRRWLRAHPRRARQVLDSDPSYVFFRRRKPGLPGPLGALGVPLLRARAIAVDPAFIPLGTPVWLDTTLPGSGRPYRRLVFAQDTGGAIKGPVRADLFFGFGNDAEQRAGSMKQRGRIYVLLPVARDTRAAGPGSPP